MFWLGVLISGEDDGRGVLCRRHADTMVVPRGWTLDDQRDPDLHLFRPPAPSPVAAAPRRRRNADERRGIVAEQLPLEEPASPAPADEPSPDPVATPWTPSFDDADDLDGLLAARSPLLARAFHGADRQRRT